MASQQQGMLRADELPAKQVASVCFHDSPPNGGEFFFAWIGGFWAASLLKEGLRVHTLTAPGPPIILLS